MIDTITIREAIADLIAPWQAERRNLLFRAATTDTLTGLGNRSAFERAQTDAEKSQNLSFIIFDANNFGLINKHCGHATGDQVLRRFAEVFQTVASYYKCSAFRLGGDEFVIICRTQFATRVRDSVETRCVPVQYKDFTVSMSGEIGSTLEEADSCLQNRKRLRKTLDR